LSKAILTLLIGSYLAVISIVVTLVAVGTGIGDEWAVVALAAVSAYSERARVRLGASLEVSISLLPALFAAVAFGPLAAMIVFSASMLGCNTSPGLARILYAATRALTGAATGLAVGIAADLATSSVVAIALSASVGAVIAPVVDTAFSSLVFYLRGHGPITRAVREYLPVVLMSVPFYMPVVTLLTLAYELLSPVTLPLFFVPAVAAQRWFLLYQEQRRLADDLGAVNQRLAAANLSFAGALVATLDARDRYTAGHSAAVAIYARDIARRLGLPDDQQELAHLAGLVHDIGKVGLPAGLLEKPGALTLEERRQMEQHPVIGERILARVSTYKEIASVVRHHHERVDGFGYPDGLTEDEIPLLARIIAAADAYNAMTSDRPYRDAMPSRVARLRLAQAVGSQFDTTVVAGFEAVLTGADEDYRLAQHPAFRLDVIDDSHRLLQDELLLLAAAH
jgi:putative nucleotidyltransferase with HDIG domain